MSFSIVIPAFNEEKSIGLTVQNCLAVFDKIGGTGGEVIVVNDGSSDRTAEIASEAGAIVIDRHMNSGYGRSLKVGIAVAKNDTIVITDADGTYPISEIPNLVDKYEEGYDLIVGLRQGLAAHDAWYKTLMRKMLKKLVEKASGYPIPDINSGLRVFSKKRTMPFFNHFSDRFSFSTSQTIAYLMTGLQVLHVPIDYAERVGKSKVRLVRDSLRTLLQIIHLVLYYKPIKIFIAMCLFCILLGLGGVGITLLTGIQAGYLLGLGSLVVSLLIFSMGLLAEQLRQLLLNNSHLAIGAQDDSEKGRK